MALCHRMHEAHYLPCLFSLLSVGLAVTAARSLTAIGSRLPTEWLASPSNGSGDN
jgi:hypothetical protein